MVINEIDNIKFRLNKVCDFSWLKKYGKAFSVIDETGSGCLCIGMYDGRKKYFCKIAGADTIEAELTPQESIAMLKKAVHLYRELQHPGLINILEDYPYGDYYIAVFEWAEGECLFDHWNFDKYSKNPLLKNPKQKFQCLPVIKKKQAVEILFSFFETAASHGYVAVDFYDGSILYDFDTDTIMFCDIDLFRKNPAINDMGENWPGTKRLKAPEEYLQGGIIDESTTVFTLGALLFEFFGHFSKEEIDKRYIENRFIPCSSRNWQLGESSYLAALKAVHPDKSRRFQTISQFHLAWENSLCNELPRRKQQGINLVID